MLVSHYVRPGELLLLGPGKGGIRSAIQTEVNELHLVVVGNFSFV